MIEKFFTLKRYIVSCTGKSESCRARLVCGCSAWASERRVEGIYVYGENMSFITSEGAERHRHSILPTLSIHWNFLL